jgi:CspA family cold shock protein
MLSGTVKSFSPVKGFGFITPDSSGVDLFAHFSNIEGEGYKTLTAGQRVQFEKGVDPQGRDQALKISTIMSEVVDQF